MQQQTLNITARRVDAGVGLGERLREVHRVINSRLDARSEFYSRVAGFAVTWRVALRVNMVTAMGLVAVVAVETAPVAALTAAAATAWVLQRWNQGKKGGRR